jgi:preprotein translocase subunit YajC
MNFELIPTVFAQEAEQAPRSNAPMWPMLLAIFAVFYFFIIRPQQKKQKDTKNMLHSLEKGSRVITIGGITGTVVSIKEKKGNPTDDDIVVIKTGDATKLEMIRSSIGRILGNEENAGKTE